MKGKNLEALEEFEKAIELCPHNEELIMTVEKIRTGLEKPVKDGGFNFQTHFNSDDDSPTL